MDLIAGEEDVRQPEHPGGGIELERRETRRSLLRSVHRDIYVRPVVGLIQTEGWSAWETAKSAQCQGDFGWKPSRRTISGAVPG
jgi:hypothetical protein